MLAEDIRLNLAKDVTFQSVGAEQDTVILSLSSGRLYSCNETTGSFLSAIDGQRNLGQIVDLVSEQYDVPREELHADLSALAERLIEEKLILVET